MQAQRRWRGAATMVVLVGVLTGFLVPTPLPEAEAAPGCGANDLPELGIPGDVPLADQLSGRIDEGYNCGLALIGYSSLGARGGNANMAWAGQCAYIAGDGVAVVDVTDPTRPVHVSTLHGSGADATVETLHAVEAADRSILVTGRYSLFGYTGSPDVGPVDIWDVSDCRNPVHLSTFLMPAAVHNLTLSADAKTMYSTLPLQAADLTDPRNPTYKGSLETALQATGVAHLMYAHEAWPSPDGKRLYVGGQIAGDEELLVIDIEGWPRTAGVRVLGRTPVPGHSIRPATIDGRPHLLASDESIVNLTANGCVPEAFTPVGSASEPYLIDLSDESRPTAVSQFNLPINEPQNCVAQLASGVNASVHYQDVDDPNDTTFAMLSMWNAGLRVIDVRDPANPKEVAYFNPGRYREVPDFANPSAGAVMAFQDLRGMDQAWAHSRYVPETGHIWLTTRTGGFWVLELEPQLRQLLDLPERPAIHPDGARPRPDATRVSIIDAGTQALYCTIAPLTSVVSSLAG